MINRVLTRRGDAELGFILHETAKWTIKGPRGTVLGQAASLRSGLEAAARLTALGRRVVALVREAPTEIVVFSGQIKSLSDVYVAPGYTGSRTPGQDDKMMHEG